MVAGSAKSHSTGGHHSAHGSSGTGATTYPDRFPNSCEFRIPGKIKISIYLFNI
jgi:hypothetical protein